MEKAEFKIDCFDTIESINKLDGLISEFRSSIGGKCYRFKNTEKDVLDSLYKLIREREKGVEEVEHDLIEFFQTKLKRYWRMKVFTSPCYEYEYLIYPYKIIPSNKYVCALTTLAINESWAILKDTGFSIDGFFDNNTKITMEEISEDEFRSMCRNKVDDVINRRMQKIQDGDPQFSAKWEFKKSDKH